MSQLQYYAYKGWGEVAKETLRYSQAVRVGDRIECSGQGGWDPTAPNGELNFPEDYGMEIAQAFENVDRTLRDAGGKGWSQVFRVNTYSTDIEAAHPFLVENYRKWLPDHQPIWTSIGVKQLGAPGMRIEVEVVAFDPQK